VIEIIIDILIFIIGIYFGSFFTLAIHRLPKSENITYKASYCPNCNHKLGILDLIPIFSYTILGGKCRYCKNKIKIKYFLIEILSGIVFLLFFKTLKLEILDITNKEIIKIIFLSIYIATLFILAGIDKERKILPKSLIIFIISISVIYIIYSYTLNIENVYAYVIYLIMMIILLSLDTLILNRKVQYSYIIQILILILYMIIFSNIYNTIITIMLTILEIGIKNIIIYLKNKKSMIIKKEKIEKPIGFFLSVSNIIVIIMTNYIINYTIKI
jgi:leader peptidase (prepilin peptidase)/N-methyltransferase